MSLASREKHHIGADTEVSAEVAVFPVVACCQNDVQVVYHSSIAAVLLSLEDGVRCTGVKVRPKQQVPGVELQPAVAD